MTSSAILLPQYFPALRGVGLELVTKMNPFSLRLLLSGHFITARKETKKQLIFLQTSEYQFKAKASFVVAVCPNALRNACETAKSCMAEHTHTHREIERGEGREKEKTDTIPDSTKS